MNNRELKVIANDLELLIELQLQVEVTKKKQEKIDKTIEQLEKIIGDNENDCICL